MHIGGAKIVIPVVMMSIRMILVVIMIVSQEPRTEQINREAQCRDGDGFAVSNRHGVEQPDRAFVGDLNGDQPQNDRAGKGSQIAELAGAEDKTPVAGL